MAGYKLNKKLHNALVEALEKNQDEAFRQIIEIAVNGATGKKVNPGAHKWWVEVIQRVAGPVTTAQTKEELAEQYLEIASQVLDEENYDKLLEAVKGV